MEGLSDTDAARFQEQLRSMAPQFEKVNMFSRPVQVANVDREVISSCIQMEVLKRLVTDIVCCTTDGAAEQKLAKVQGHGLDARTGLVTGLSQLRERTFSAVLT